jgi:hypothetical protein
MPAPNSARLPEKVLLVTLSGPVLSQMPPPPVPGLKSTLLPAKVLFVTVIVPWVLKMPLPLPELFSEKMLFVTVALAVLKTPPPWPPWALLAEKLLLMMLSVPKKASIPAPSPPFAEQMLLVTVSPAAL